MVLFYLTITVAIVFLGCVFEIQGKSDKYPTVSSEGKPPPTPGKTFARFLSWLIFGDKMGFPVQTDIILAQKISSSHT